MTRSLCLMLLGACAGRDLGARTPPVDDDDPAAEDTSTPTDNEPSDTAVPTSSETADTGGTVIVPARPFLFVGGGDDRIHVFAIDPATGALTALSAYDAGSSPTFLAASPDRRALYAVNEGSSELAAFTIDPADGALTLLNRVPSNGGGPAHLTVDATGLAVLAANYGGGTVTMVAVEPDGRLGAERATLYTGANAHQIVVDPGNRFVFVPNLGDDDVSQLVLDPAAGTLVENAVPSLSVADDAGPRHLVFHPTAPFAYLVNETDDTMVALAYDAANGRLAALQTVSTLPDGVDGGGNSCAEVAFGASGRFLYGTNRGHDSLVIYEVDPVSGLLALVGHQDTGGSWPRHFSIDPSGRFLFVGNQQSDTIVSFTVDGATGALTELATTSVPGPAFVGVFALPEP